MWASTVRKIVLENAAKESELHTDEARFYKRIGKHFAAHGFVTHSKGEYARGGVTSNTVATTRSGQSGRLRAQLAAALLSPT